MKLSSIINFAVVQGASLLNFRRRKINENAILIKEKKKIDQKTIAIIHQTLFLLIEKKFHEFIIFHLIA